jgi:hypothetical protein
MRKKLFSLVTVFLTVISLSLLPACEEVADVVDDAIDDGTLDQIVQDVTGILGSDNDGETAGGGIGKALSIAEKVTVIDIKTTQNKPAFVLALERAAASAVPADSDYAVAKANQEIYVTERSDEGFEVANMLLCLMDQLGYEEMTNKGAYVALVDSDKCDNKRGDAKENSSSGAQEASNSQQSGSSDGATGVVNYERWVIVSYRESDTSSQNVRFWVEDEGGKGGDGGDGKGDDGPPMTIEARLVIDEGKSDSNPFGIFNMNFRGVITKEFLQAVIDSGDTLPAGVTADADYQMMTGFLSTELDAAGEVQLKVVMDDTMPDNCATYTQTVTSTLFRNLDSAGALDGTGHGKLDITESQTATSDATVLAQCISDYRIESDATVGEVKSRSFSLSMAYDADYFQRKDLNPYLEDGTTANDNYGTYVCLDRNDPVETAWRYSLFKDEYDSTDAGGALHLNTGFPIIWTDDAGEEFHGYVGYWGLWDPSGALADGDTVQKEQWGDTATAIDLAVFKGDGKLHKHTTKEITLADLTGVDLYAGIGDGSGNWVQYILQWDGTSLMVVGLVDESNWQPIYWGTGTDDATTDTDGDDSTNEYAYVPKNVWEMDLWFWSQVLNGGGRLKVIGNQYWANNDLVFDSADNTITNSGGGFTDAGFVDGDTIIIGNSASNDGSYTIVGTPTNTVITVSEALTDETAWVTIAEMKTLADADPVVFQVESIVDPGDTSVPATLACLDNCPDPSVLDTYDSDAGEEPHYAISTWNAPAGTGLNEVNGGYWDDSGTEVPGLAPTTAAHGEGTTETGFIGYKFDTTNYRLNVGLDGSGSSVVQTTDASGNNWSVNSGAMFDPTVDANWDALACDWNTSVTCTWKTHELETFYTWETGVDSWSRYTGLKKDTGAFLSFSPPLQVEYTHEADGSKYMLEYNGYGELNGIPGMCVSQDTGLDVDCWDIQDWRSVRWVPQFMIPDGSVITAENPRDGTSNTYYSLALEKEQRLKGTTAGYCVDLNIPTMDLPVIADYVDPTIGTMPVVDAAPAVIGGVVQEAPAS